MRIRDAAVTDLDDVVRLTRAARQELAKWSPVYFRKREGSDEAHAGFLQFLLGSADHRTNVIEDEGRAIGFFQVVPQPSHWWVDDLCLEHERWWPSVCAALSTELPDRPWVTCVSELDTERARALSGTGLRITSSYWSRSLPATEPPGSTASPISERPSAEWPAHTFGGAPFDPGVPGALAVIDSDGNFAIGSPSVEPPIYDPGGPTCVIDGLGGPDRGNAIDLAIRCATARRDAQLVVVSSSKDRKLDEILGIRRFTKHVNLFVLSA